MNQIIEHTENNSNIIKPADETTLYEAVKEERESRHMPITFGFKEFCTFLNVSQSSIIRKEKEHKELMPNLVAKGKREYRTYSPEDAVKARKVIGVPSPIGEKKVFVFNNMKGGTGKSMQSLNFASFCACAGLKVLVADGCGQGHLSYHMGLVPHRDMNTLAHIMAEGATVEESIQKTRYPNVDLIPGTVMLNHLNEYIVSEVVRHHQKIYELKIKATEKGVVFDPTQYEIENPIYYYAKLMKQLKSKYDVIIIDTAPSFDHRTQALLMAADILVVPVQLAYEATLGMADFFYLVNWLRSEYPNDVFSLSKSDIKILPTFGNNHNVSKHVLGFLIENYSEHMMESTIRHAEVNKQATSHATATFIYDKRSDAATDHIKAARELLNIKPMKEHAWL